MTIILDALSAQPQWSKVKFFWDHGITNLTATSTEVGYDALNMLNMLDLSFWKATDMVDQNIKFMALAPYTADYLAIGDHNLGSVGATVALQFSSDDFSADIVDAFTPFIQPNNRAIVVEFPSRAAAFTRLKLTTMTGAPLIGKCIWGRSTELHWVAGNFDPNAENDKANVVVSSTGYLLGIHETYIERNINLAFRDMQPSTFAKIKAWHDAVGLNNFFMAWEITQHPDDVFIVRADPQFNNPLKYGGIRRDVNLRLIGRKD